MIELKDIQTVTEHCLRLLSFTEYLRREDTSKDAYELAEKLFPSLRKLFIASMLHHKQLICVSGLQGAGKTTLMKNFYGIDEKFMNVSIGRGERIPILITEGKVDAPSITAVKVVKGEEGYCEQKVILQEDEIIHATKGEDATIMYIELTVPYKHTNNSGVSFMLLPGFEKNNDYWNDLIEFSVNSSDAAVFVFDESSFSNAANENYLNRIESKFGSNVVYAISHSDESSDDNAGVKNTCIDVLQIKEIDRVVCVGQYSNVEKNDAWITSFKEAIDKYALFETQVMQKTNSYIYDELLNIKGLLYDILNILNDGDDFETKEYHNHALLKAFDKAIAKKREELALNLSDEFAIAKEKSSKYIAKQLDSRPFLKNIKKTLFGTNIKEEYIETQQLIKDSLIDNGVCLPDLHMGGAFQKSIKLIDSPKTNNPNALQLLVDTKENNGGRELLDTPDTRNAIQDVCALVQIPSKNANRYMLQSTDPNRVVQAVSEIATYYYGLTSYNKLAEVTSSLVHYSPSNSGLKGQDIIQGAESSKKLAIGLAGVMGVDVLADGSLNLISQVATSCSIGIPYAAAAAVLVVGTGAATAIMKDVNRMQRADYESARMTINVIYDNLQKETLSRFDKFTTTVRDRIEDNIADLGGGRKLVVTNYNAKVEVNNLLNLLDKMTEDYQRASHNVGTYFSR